MLVSDSGWLGWHRVTVLVKDGKTIVWVDGVRQP